VYLSGGCESVASEIKLAPETSKERGKKCGARPRDRLGRYSVRWRRNIGEERTGPGHGARAQPWGVPGVADQLKSVLSICVDKKKTGVQVERTAHQRRNRPTRLDVSILLSSSLLNHSAN